MSTSHFILEGAIFQEAEVVKKTPNKAIYRMVLQTSDDVNQNKRMYPHSVLDEGIKQCIPRMNKKAFYGELDHPIPTGNDTFDGIRQTTVLLKEVSHYIRNHEWQGNKLIGELETATTSNGQKLLGLLHDRSGLGVSMRGMASLKKLEKYNQVEGPLTIVAFDSVSQPSHKSAIVNFNEVKFENTNMLIENYRETKNLICINNQCFLPNYFDKLVQKNILEFINRWV